MHTALLLLTTCLCGSPRLRMETPSFANCAQVVIIPFHCTHCNREGALTILEKDGKLWLDVKKGEVTRD